MAGDDSEKHDDKRDEIKSGLRFDEGEIPTSPRFEPPVPMAPAPMAPPPAAVPAPPVFGDAAAEPMSVEPPTPIRSSNEDTPIPGASAPTSSPGIPTSNHDFPTSTPGVARESRMQPAVDLKLQTKVSPPDVTQKHAAFDSTTAEGALFGEIRTKLASIAGDMHGLKGDVGGLKSILNKTSNQVVEDREIMRRHIAYLTTMAAATFREVFGDTPPPPPPPPASSSSASTSGSSEPELAFSLSESDPHVIAAKENAKKSGKSGRHLRFQEEQAEADRLKGQEAEIAALRIFMRELVELYKEHRAPVAETWSAKRLRKMIHFTPSAVVAVFLGVLVAILLATLPIWSSALK